MGALRAAIAGVQGSLYLLVLAINSSMAVARGVAEWPGEIPMWGGLATMTRPRRSCCWQTSLVVRRRDMLARAGAVWFGIMLLAILNGAARDVLLVPRLGDLVARALSCVTLAGLIVLVTGSR